MEISKENKRKLIVFGIIIVTLFIVSHIPGVREYFTIEKVNSELEYLKELAGRPYGPPIYILALVAFVILHLPVMLMVIIGGLIFSFRESLFYSWVGCTLGASTSFLIAKYFLHDFFRPKLEKSRLKKLLERLENDGIFTMIMLRLFMFMAAPLNWVIGATGLKYRDFLIGTAIGILPFMAAVLLTASKMQSVTSMREVVKIETVFIMAVAFGVFAAIAVARKKYFPQNRIQNEKVCEASEKAGEIE